MTRERALLAFVIVAACAPAQPTSLIDVGPTDGTDSGAVWCPTANEFENDYVARSTPAPEGGWCCPHDVPQCDCAFLGGWAERRCDCVLSARHDNICDLAPVEWILEDDHGCEVYRAPSFPTQSCL